MANSANVKNISPILPGRPSLVIWGAGGHAQVIADIAQVAGSHNLLAFVDNVSVERDRFIGEYPVLSCLDELQGLLTTGQDEETSRPELIIGIGDCVARARIAKEVEDAGFRLATLKHPRATIAINVTIGYGTVVAAGAVINTGTIIGNNTIINTSASVDHHCRIGDAVHVCPGCHIAGGVRIGSHTLVGIGSAVINSLEVGESTIIGAGSVVVRNIPDRVLAFGNPARVIRAL